MGTGDPPSYAQDFSFDGAFSVPTSPTHSPPQSRRSSVHFHTPRDKPKAYYGFRSLGASRSTSAGPPSQPLSETSSFISGISTPGPSRRGSFVRFPASLDVLFRGHRRGSNMTTVSAPEERDRLKQSNNLKKTSNDVFEEREGDAHSMKLSRSATIRPPARKRVERFRCQLRKLWNRRGTSGKTVSERKKGKEKEIEPEGEGEGEVQRIRGADDRVALFDALMDAQDKLKQEANLVSQDSARPFSEIAGLRRKLSPVYDVDDYAIADSDEEEEDIVGPLSISTSLQGFRSLHITTKPSSPNHEIILESMMVPICSKFKNIFESKEKYRAVLACRDVTAQKILDLLQVVLDYPLLDLSLKNNLLIASIRLSKRSSLYPKCFTLKTIQRGEYPITAGAFGEIWKGHFHGQPVCLKMVKVYERSHVERLLTAFSREAIVWRHVSHPNLLPFYGIYRLEDAYGRICLVSPWMDYGNVNSFLEQNPRENRVLLISDIISGISYLHENSIIHGDLKGANILVTSARRACVADFGLSSVIDADILKWTSVESTGGKGGTVRWQARELVDPDLDNARPTRESDMYAFSCVCYEIFTGRVPFYESPHEATVMFKVMRGNHPSRPPEESLAYLSWGLTDSIWNLMEECWRSLPSTRPTAHEVIQRLPLVDDDRPSGAWGLLSPMHFRNAAQDTTGYLYMEDIESIMHVLGSYSD